MKRMFAILSVGLLLLAITSVAGATTVDLFGASYIQSGSISNDSGQAITDFIYSLGTAEDNVATWDTFGAGTASDIFGTSWAQTVTWSGLSILPGTSWTFSGLDIDMITNALSGIVSHQILDFGSYSSLRNASVAVIYADGSSESANLFGSDGWRGVHDYVLGNGINAPVPEPSTIILLGAGLTGLAFYRRKKNA